MREMETERRALRGRVVRSCVFQTRLWWVAVVAEREGMLRKRVVVVVARW